MKTIWKYTLSPTQNLYQMPKDAKVLYVAAQDDNLCLWVKVNSDAELEDRCIEIFGTGHEMPCGMGIDRKYLGSVMMYNNTLVFHVYERML